MTSLKHWNALDTIGKIGCTVVAAAVRLARRLIDPNGRGWRGARARTRLRGAAVGPDVESTARPFSMSVARGPEGLVWPDIGSMLGGDFELTWARRAKYGIRLLATREPRQRLLEDHLRTPFEKALLGEHPRALYPLMNHLLDRRFDARERLSATVASLSLLGSWLPELQQEELLKHDLTLLTLDDGTRLTFGLSGVSFHEGLWQVGLISQSGTRLYSLGFGLTDASTLLIANVQGPSVGTDGPALIRQVTHAAHGMRPPYLLVHTLRLLAREWGVETLLGIDAKNHIKGRWNLRRSRLRFDYEGFWTERGATRDSGGNWRLPLVVDDRALADVPAKRRAMYRRRFDMLARLEDALHALSSSRWVVPGVNRPTGLSLRIEEGKCDRAETPPCDPLSKQHEPVSLSDALP